MLLLLPSMPGLMLLLRVLLEPNLALMVHALKLT
jgi:hypothetical protein